MKPFQLVDLYRIPDEELQRHLWSGLVSFVLKHRKDREYEKFLEKLFPWMREIDIQHGEDYVRIVLKYSIDQLEIGFKFCCNVFGLRHGHS